MAYIADLHIHSRFSRACSPQINIPNLAKWAKIKGIDVLGTSDILHPIWRAEVKSLLKDLGNGIFEYDGVKFILSVELACIYSDKGKLRRIHLLVLLPSFEGVERIADELLKRNVKLASDGRPMMGLSARILSGIIFENEPGAIIIPAHIWTPWFSLYGANSGYDSLRDCFEDLSERLLAIETGEYSDPAMNWRIKDLDSRTILSFSDSHSLPNLGREATIFGGELSFKGMLADIKNQNIVGTIEFFPEEGKYHYSGHRDHKVILSSEEVKKEGEICAVCGKKLTLGVTKRVEDLAARTVADLKLKTEDGVIKSGMFPTRPGFRKLIQLSKIIAEVFGVGNGSKRVQKEYDRLILALGAELLILTKIPVEEIEKVAGKKIAEGIVRIREGRVKIKPGYDGVYGEIEIWDEGVGQEGLFEV